MWCYYKCYVIMLLLYYLKFRFCIKMSILNAKFENKSTGTVLAKAMRRHDKLYDVMMYFFT